MKTLKENLKFLKDKISLKMLLALKTNIKN